jgi:hypothetical protein
MENQIVAYFFYLVSILNLKITVFFNVTLCNLMDTYQRFGETFCLHLQWNCIEMHPHKAFLCQIEVLMLMTLNNIVFWNVTPGSMVSDILFLT